MGLIGDARTCTEYLALISADVAVWWGAPPVEYKLSADFTTDGLYLGEEFRLMEAPVPLVDDEAFPTPAEEDGEELKPGL